MKSFGRTLHFLFATLLIAFTFQNCGEIGIVRQMSSEAVQDTCSDQSIYEIYSPVSDGLGGLKIRRTTPETSNEYLGTVTWSVDGVGRSTLPIPPNCSGHPNYAVQATFLNTCDQPKVISATFADPRCLQVPPTTVPTPTTAPPPLAPNIPGTGAAANTCDPNEQPVPRPEGFTVPVVPPLGNEPPVPLQCLNLNPDLADGKVLLNFGPVSSDTMTPSQVQTTYANGHVSRNLAFNNAYSRSCTGSGAQGFQMGGGFHKNEFVSMRFVPMADETGTFTIYGHSIGATNSNAFLSLSECPGDFGKVEPVPGAQSRRTLNYYASEEIRNYNFARPHGTGGGVNNITLDNCMGYAYHNDIGIELRWTTNPGYAGCLLEAGKSYYVNIVFRNPVSLEPTCPRTFPLENENVGYLSDVTNCGFRFLSERGYWQQ